MSKIFIYHILFASFFFLWQIVASQDIKFTVHLAGKEIGEVHARLFKVNDTHTYEVNSDVNFKVFWKEYNRKTNNHVVYQNNKLVSSYNSVYMNKEMEDTSAINHHQQKYNCYRYPHDKMEIPNEMVEFSTVRLYFTEPEGITNIYSERFLMYCPLEQIEDHKYKLSLPNGKENFYTYLNKKLIEVFVDRSWFNLRFLKQ